ncbi:zinc finger protein 384-like [Uloborus diversus]|uniref:zinc finger protein 384-like n=1 Tax=Uloborus diversus TaxID=327109 RepID=UPI0024099C40|nr:zinc finger protein 384-like [Uloborus diversus]
MEDSTEEGSPVYITESCCVCDEEFSSDTELANHLVQHVNDEEYKCILDGSCKNDLGAQAFTSGSRKTPLTRTNSISGRSGSPEVWEILSDDSDDESARGAKSVKLSNSFRLVSGSGNAQNQTVNPSPKQQIQQPLRNGKHKQNLKPSSKPGQPLKCPQCSLTFKENKSLQEHLLMHDNPRPYTCQICSKNFAYKATLRQHLHQHIGDKSHECKICHKKFSIKSMLRKHEEQHEQQKIHDRMVTTQLRSRRKV